MRWQRLTDFFRLIGFYALFAFVMHRVLLQTIYIALNVLELEDTRYQYSLLLTSTMLITFGLCWWRRRHAEVLRTSARAVETGPVRRHSEDFVVTRTPATVGMAELVG